MCEKQILQYAARYAQGAKKLIEIQLGKFKPVACVAKSPPQETNSPELKQNGEENGGKGLEDGGDELRAPSSSKGEENSEDTISATEPPAVGSNEKSDGVEEAMGIQEGETSEQLQEGSNTEQTAATQEHEQQQQKAKEDDDGHKVEGEDGSHEQESNS